MLKEARIVTAVLAMTFPTVGATAQAPKPALQRDIDIAAPDGVVLKASYFSPGVAGPALLMLHQCNFGPSERHAWDGLASDLVAAGFHVLTMDFRGYGESGGERTREKWPADVDAVYAWLLAQPGVDRSRIAAGGASCGVVQSTELASRRPEIKALVVLSGTATEPARAYIAENPSLAVFGAAAEGDAGSARGIRQIFEASKSPQSTLKIYPGKEHGEPMFGANPELRPLIVSWLKQQLRAN